ncbi:hypothetical protein VCR14J2_380002 [Vibrio coralliirubri]|nr:hypothetical protein VCR14J2_380002 [Vibrio coralliirubri]
MLLGCYLIEFYPINSHQLLRFSLPIREHQDIVLTRANLDGIIDLQKRNKTAKEKC